MNFDLLGRTALLTLAGSRAYGTHLPDSDVDIKGVAIAPAKCYLGFTHGFDQADKPGNMSVFLPLLTEDEQRSARTTKLEGTVFNLRKFMKLASECNPNILDVLFCRDQEVRLTTPVGTRLRQHRDLFVSAKARFTFAGYAHAQLKRIEGHRAWLLRPPSHAPTRKEFGLPEFTLLPADQLAAAQAAVKDQMATWDLDLDALDPADVENVQRQVSTKLAEIQTALGFPDPDAAVWLAAARVVGLEENVIYTLQQERAYENAQHNWKQYMNWKGSRNPERAQLEAKFGYDCKHAGHLIRLLRMGVEILETGRVHVWRGPEDDGPGDAQEILSIRHGAWSYDRLMEETGKLDAHISALYEAKNYVVPRTPPLEKLDALCVQLLEEVFAVDKLGRHA
jgi:hypothetical protein